VKRVQTLTFIVASLLVGVSIAVAGPIGFVGLIVPHALRSTLGPDHRLLIPMAALGGAALLLFCDSIARMAIGPAQLPAGAVTAVLGGPFFIAILIGQRRRAALWGGK
jgi:iron complex transport system permease protein